MNESAKQAETVETRTPIRVHTPMAGALVVEAGGERVALGFPEEVVKAWMRAGLQPGAWVVPDVRSAGGIVQWAFEFPLYHALFVQGLFAKGLRVPVLVHERDWPELVEYLRLTLLGLERDELRRAGVKAERAEALSSERDALALRRPDGELARIEDMLEPRFFDAEGRAAVGELTVQSHGDNTYSFYTADDRIEQLRLEVGGEAAPPYGRPLLPATSPVAPQPFEVIALGTSTGFDPAAPCTSLLVQAHGRFVLVDAGPYVRSLLAHAGVSLDSLSAVVITHAHEDHAVGLSALLGTTHRLRLFATREVAAVLSRKLAILNPELRSPDSLLAEAFDLTTVEPGEELDYLGLRMRFHHTLHSIPCAGVELSLEAGGLERRVLVVGDTVSRERYEKLVAAGVVGAARQAELEALWSWRGDLLFADAGAGAIHGGCADFDGAAAGAVVCVHTPALPPAERHRRTLAAPGDRYRLIAEHERPSPIERGLAERALVEAFGAAGSPWLGAMLDAARPLEVNRGQVVVRQGGCDGDVYLALGGELSVWLDGQGGEARRVAGLCAGEVFGEMAPLTGAARSATVRAETPARLLRLRGEAFRRFAAEANLVTALPAVWEKRRSLEAVGPLSGASVTVRNQLARAAVCRTIGPGATLIREGSRSDTVFVLVRGRVQVYRGEQPLLAGGAPVIVPPGTLIGETAPFLKTARNASIVTLDECEVLAIRGEDFKRIVRGAPGLYCAISRIVRARAA